MPTEIFDKAREYASDIMMHDNTDMLDRSYPHKLYRDSGEGEMRLHYQAIKLLSRAFHDAAKDVRDLLRSKLDEDQALIERLQQAGIKDVGVQQYPSYDQVITALDALEERFSKGWKKDEDDFVYKDFADNTDGQLLDTLNFIKKDLNVVLKEQSCPGPIAEAKHLKIDEESYHMVFNPRTHYELYEKGRGEGLGGVG